MACATLHFHSPALAKACSMTVIVPECSVGTPPFPVCYLLHGLSDDHTSWARRTSIERYVAGLPLLVVMPDGGRGFYCDAVEGPAYERYLLEDVIGFVDRTFHTIPERQGRVIDNTFRAGEKVELVDFEEKHMQYLYKDDRYNFMDTETYDQISLSADEVGDARDFLKENTEVDILFIDGSPVTVELPNFLELQIVKTDPGVRGDTASGGNKPATLETGAVIQVPLFLNEGDIVKVDTRSWDYLGRVAAAG